MKTHFSAETQRRPGPRLEPGNRRQLNGRPVLDPRLSPLSRRARSGVALIITLIMLSVITFMAVTFLVLSHRERGAVTTTTDQATAQFAAETAQERAEVEILSRIMAQTNDQAYDLMVSTNFINTAGFDAGAGDYRTNVNYDYLKNGGPLSQLNVLTVLTNLLLDPRPPVYVTNRYLGGSEFRYYLDLNRNGRDETNGALPLINSMAGGPYYNAISGLPTNRLGNVMSNTFVGDPDWIGVLEYPGQPHSANNKFLSRYAYLVVPAGKTLDVNYIHNDAGLDQTAGNGDWPYRRDMGVGSWEINLAAFLVDLNTNEWGALAYPDSTTYYEYLPPWINSPNGSVARGLAFDDANSILNYRYAGSYNNLQSLKQLFSRYPTFQGDYIDEFGGGGPNIPISSYLTNSPLPLLDADNARVDKFGWPGADNPNHFFTHQEFFDPAKTSGAAVPAAPGFTNRLMAAGATNDSYDRYTFYRMLAQLGSDSVPDQNKMNVNYDNLDSRGNVVPGMETNMIQWDPVVFFTNAAQRMFTQLNMSDADSNLVTVTHIPVYLPESVLVTGPAGNQVVSNYFKTYYTPAVHHILQLAANMYDATTNQTSLTTYPYLPHVFRPLFRRDPATTNIFIVAYREVKNDTLTLANLNPAGQMVDLDQPADRSRVPALGTAFGLDQAEPMVYGIPLIIGAKKGFPNFNEFSMQNMVLVTRKLQFRRGRPTAEYSAGQVVWTNQMYTIGISNTFGIEGWNSYSNRFPRSLRLSVQLNLFVSLTNELGGNLNVLFSNAPPFTPTFIASTFFTNLVIPANGWPGWTNDGSAMAWSYPPSMFVPLSNYFPVLPFSSWTPDGTTPLSPLTGRFSTLPTYFPVPHWWLNLKERVWFFLVDTSVNPNRIVDYVNLSRTEDPMDITSMLQNSGGGCTGIPADGSGNPWCTNRFGTTNELDSQFPTIGIMNQITRSKSQVPDTGDPNYVWDTISQPTLHYAIDSFRNQFLPDGSGSTIFPEDQGLTFYKSNTFYAPLDPAKAIFTHVTWQANDPLVHYTIGDLVWGLTGTNVDYASYAPPLRNMGRVNAHYEPWVDASVPLPPSYTQGSSPTAVEISVKDPLVRCSDDWDFPTNKFPNVGWLGRVHRGTPWQTVYLKAPDNTNMWSTWTQTLLQYQYSSQIGGTNYLDSILDRPAMDRNLFDLFTASINDNATRGRLSINQTNLAAWSAVLSGVIVQTNSASTADLTTSPSTARFDPLVIPPAGVYGPDPAQWPPLVRIVNGINAMRANTNPLVGPVFPNHEFGHLGDILAVPELTGSDPTTNASYSGTYPNGHWNSVSPFLYWGNPNSQQTSRYEAVRGINDEAYERIPQQIMGLLSLSHTPRFVIYSYGQTLHPADRSIYTTAGPFFGLCTNYQVTAETASRAVVRVDGSPDPQYTRAHPDSFGNYYPPRIVVEQFNMLPSD